jgi:hypothetical protein
MIPTVLFDVDHTVSAADRRVPLMGQWDLYHTDSANDECYPEMIHLIKSLGEAGWYTIGFTARPALYKPLTLEWLKRQGIVPDEMLMRIDNDWRPSVEMKLELFKARFPNPEDWGSIILIEDHPDISEAFAALNITVLRCYCRIKDNPQRNYNWKPA